MKTKRRLVKITVTGILFVSALVISYLVATYYQNMKWLIWLMIPLTALFSFEARKAIDGQRITWSYISFPDRVLFLVGLALFFIFTIYPVKTEMPTAMIILLLIIGYIVFWGIITRFGSEVAREKLFPKKK